MSMTTVLIAEDEHLAAEALADWVKATPGLQLVAVCEDGEDALAQIRALKPALVLTDIQMPGLTGLQVVQALQGHDWGSGHQPRIIFTTAYDQHALTAFELHAVDYLLKPFAQDRFDAALARARRLIGQPTPGLDRLLSPAAPHIARVLVRDPDTPGGLQVLAVDDIAYIESQADNVAFHAHGREHLKAQRISELEAQLDPTRFVRVHRSFIIHLAALQGLEKTDSDAYIARMKNGKRIPVSRSGYDRLRSVL